jgi:hypothetical protein
LGNIKLGDFELAQRVLALDIDPVAWSELTLFIIYLKLSPQYLHLTRLMHYYRNGRQMHKSHRELWVDNPQTTPRNLESQ